MAQIKMFQSDIAEYIGVDAKTIYNWKKHKPNLYRTLIIGLKYEALMSEVNQWDKELPRNKNVEHPFNKRYGGKGES